jgi:chromosome segregation ATPase
MSDGKKFAAKALLSAEDRLTEIERKYSVIQERIQAYDAVLSEFQSLKSDLKQLKASNASLVASFNSITEDTRVKMDVLTGQIQTFKGKYEYITKSLEENKESFCKFSAKTNQNFIDFDKFVSKIKDQVSSCLEQNAEITKIQSDYQLCLNTIARPIGLTKAGLDKLTADHIRFKDSTEASQAALTKEISKLTASVAALPSLQEWSNKLYGRVQQELTYREKQATAYVDKKVESLAKDFDSNPLSAEGVKNALFKEIEALALDGKNAYLKSNNCATQITLLEKKLENINLLIKKYELNK